MQSWACAAVLLLALPAVATAASAGGDAGPGHLGATHAASPSADPAQMGTALAGFATGLAAHGVRVGSAPAPQRAPGGTSQIEFVCPAGDPTQVQNADATDRTVLGCPFRVYDTTYLLGSPHVFVREEDPRSLLFVATHGERVSGSSYDVRAHTAFTSGDQGVSWGDNPTNSGPYTARGASTTMDDAGNVYLGYLYSRQGPNGTTGAGRVELYDTQVPADGSGAIADQYGRSAWSPRARIHNDALSALSLVHVPANRTLAPASGATEPGNTSSAPPPAQGQLAAPKPPQPGERIVAMWLESSRAEGGFAGKSGWIDFATLVPGKEWRQAPAEQVIGPCSDASDAASHDGLVYVACAVAAGYDARRGARVGDVDVWRLDVDTGNTTLMGFSRLSGGHPLLAVNGEGYMAVVTTGSNPDHTARVEASFGWYGRQWTAPRMPLGNFLHQLAGALPARSAAVTGIALSDQDKTLALLYTERLPTSAQQPPVPRIDPNNPPDPDKLQDIRLTEYRKLVLTLNECSGPIAAATFTTGTGLDAYQLEAYSENPDIYNDTREGIQARHDPGGGEVFYFAVSDYGAMQFGGFLVNGNSAPCFVVPPLPSIPVPALPQALSLANPANLMVGATVGAASLAMVGYLLAAKRRTPNRLAVKQK